MKTPHEQAKQYASWFLKNCGAPLDKPEFTQEIVNQLWENIEAQNELFLTLFALNDLATSENFYSTFAMMIRDRANNHE